MKEYAPTKLVPHFNDHTTMRDTLLVRIQNFFGVLCACTMLFSANAQIDTLGWDEFYAVGNECFEDPFQAPGSHLFNAGVNSFGNIDVVREYQNSGSLDISEVIIDVFELSNWNGGVADITIYEMLDDNGDIEPHPLAFQTYSPSQDPAVPPGVFPAVTNNIMISVTFSPAVTVTGNFAVGISLGESELGGPANFVLPFGLGLNEAFGISHTLRSEPAPMGGHSWLQWASNNSGGINSAGQRIDWTRFDDGASLTAVSSGALEMSVDLGIFPVVAQGAVGIAENLRDQQEEILVYPNPTKGELNVDLSRFLDLQKEIELYSLVGELVFSENITAVYSYSLDLQALGLSTGIYVLKVKSDQVNADIKVNFVNR